MTISLERVSFAYPGENRSQSVLQDVSFVLSPGACVALIGPSGSGKSTLAQLLNGLLQPSQGQVCLEGRPLDYKPSGLKTLRRKVALVFQFPEAQIFEQTVFDEVAFAARQWGVPEAELPALVQRALGEVGLEPEAFLHRPPLKLSGGEDRLITIASLLVVDPEWLILDEPTLGLDFRHTELIKAMIRGRQTTQRGVLLITHDLDFALDLCPRALVLQQGCLDYDGSATSLLTEHDLAAEFGLADPESLRIWKFLRMRIPEAPFPSPQQLASFLEGSTAEMRCYFQDSLQEYIQLTHITHSRG